MLILSIIIVFCLLALLLHLHVKYPDNIYIVVAREWQSLISAVIGFTSLAIIYVLTNAHNKFEENKQKTEYEIAYIAILLEDIQQFQQGVSFRYELLGRYSGKEDARNCMLIIGGFKTKPIRKYLVDNYMASQIEKVTPSTMKFIYDMTYIRNTYLDFINEVSQEGCATNPKKVFTVLRGAHLDTIHTLEQKQERISTYLQLLITITEQGYDSKFQNSKYEYGLEHHFENHPL